MRKTKVGLRESIKVELDEFILAMSVWLGSNMNSSQPQISHTWKLVVFASFTALLFYWKMLLMDGTVNVMFLKVHETVHTIVMCLVNTGDPMNLIFYAICLNCIIA
jgi:hypothetical protein